MEKGEVANLQNKAKLIRKRLVKLFFSTDSGHPGGSLSLVELLTVLYFFKMRHDSRNPKWDERDRVVLSKGHAAPALYATLAEAGYFPLSELTTLRRMDSRLQGHADVKAPGVDVSTGSLGQGLSIANGLALAAKLRRMPYRTFAILGDGEIQEGQIWEAAMTAAHYKLDNLTALLDRNGLQQSGRTEEIKPIEPIASKWRAFGWHASVVNGHSVSEIGRALEEAESIRGKPSIVILQTIKGKGVSFMENAVTYHGKVPDRNMMRVALREQLRPSHGESR